MKKFIIILLSCFLLQGCSLAKTLISPFKTTISSTPQETTISKGKITCKGEYQLDENGNVIYCSKGYSDTRLNSEVKDRKLTLREKIAQFIAKGAGYLVWLAIIACVLTFFGFGWIVSGIINSIFGVGKVLRQVIKGVQVAKNNETDLVTALNGSTDEDVKKFISDFKLKNNIK